MSSTLKHIKRGDIITAAHLNAIVDELNALRAGLLGGGVVPDPITPSCMVLVRNDTGAKLPSRSVVRVDDWVITPVSQPFEVMQRPALKGNTPNATTNAIAILYDAIPSGEFGRAVLIGVAVADVLVNDASHTWAQPIASDNTRLGSATSGPARILKWETSGSTRRAILALGDGQGSGTGTELKGLTFTSDTDSTADSDPGAGLFKWNNATQSSATKLFFDNQTADGVSLTTFWPALGRKGDIFLQQADDSTKWQLWNWTASPTDGTGYHKFSVAQYAGGAIADGKTVYALFMAHQHLDNIYVFGAAAGSTGVLISQSAATESSPPGPDYCGIMYNSDTQVDLRVVDSGSAATYLQINADGTVNISTTGATPRFAINSTNGITDTIVTPTTITVVGGIITAWA